MDQTFIIQSNPIQEALAAVPLVPAGNLQQRCAGRTKSTSGGWTSYVKPSTNDRPSAKH